jgi:hypothetical protein
MPNIVGAPRRFRIEYQSEGRSRILGWAEGLAAHHHSLAPYVSRLRLDAKGTFGMVVLVDEATGAIVARRRLGPSHLT